MIIIIILQFHQKIKSEPSKIGSFAGYYHIGVGELRRIAEEHPDADLIIRNGNRVLFKRERSERFLDGSTVI